MSVDLSKYQSATKNHSETRRSKNEGQSGLLEFLNRDIQIGGNFGDSKKESFYGDLHTLLSTGIDLTTSLKLLRDEQRKNKGRDLYSSIVDRIISGQNFSEALEATGKFSEYESSSIRIGEQSGKLTGVLKQLKKYYTSRIKLKRQMINAFTYPIFILVVAVGVVYFMLTSVVPMFEDVFSQFDKELPALTQTVVMLSEMAQMYAPYIAAMLFLLGVFLFWKRKSEWFRKGSSWLILRIPLFGPVIRKVYTARLCQFMYLLTSSKTPLIEAVELMKGVVGLYPMERSLDEICLDLRKGESLNFAMAKHKIYDTRLITLVKVSEETNNLDETFKNLSEQYSSEVEYRMSVLSTLLEPFIIILVGLFIGVIILSMYLPMFELTSTFQ